MPEMKKLSRKTRKMLAILEAPVAEAKARVVGEARRFADDSSPTASMLPDSSALFAAVSDLRKAEALLAAAVEVAHA